VTDRGSSQHSPRVDDELAHETEDIVRSTHESRVEEWRMTEPPADGEPMPDTMPYEDEIEFRSLLATSLRPSAFPCRRARLLGVAEEEFAPVRIVVALRALPAEQEFHNVEEVWEALGGRREERQHEEHQHEVRVETPPPPPAAAPQPSLVEQAGMIAGTVARIACDVVSDAVRRVRSLI
jgi:uncharacterized protein DUF2795